MSEVQNNLDFEKEPVPALTKEIAEQFAIMLSSGMPSSRVMPYFMPTHPAKEQAAVLEKWLRSPQLGAAIRKIQGKTWQDMSIEEKIQFAIDKHYTEMAYYLYSYNYCDLTGAEKTKADTCRSALEAKLAGMAGKMDAISRFYKDLINGKVGLPAGKVDPGPKEAIAASLIN